MKFLLCVMVLFSNLIADEKHSGASVVKQPKKHNYLTLYKDRCLASLRLQFPAGQKKHHVTEVPASISTQSILFNNDKNGLPEYFLRKENDKSLVSELHIMNELGFDGQINFSFSGITWHMHYVIEVTSAFDKILNFNGFISVDNQSGIDFENYHVRFIDAQTNNAKSTQSFKEYVFTTAQSIFKQVVTRLPWINIENQKCVRDYRLDVGGDNLKDFGSAEKNVPLQIWLQFDNTKLGKDLANGDIEFYIRDNDELRYIGSSALLETMSSENIRVGLPSHLLSQLGTSKDSPLSQIKGSLEQTEYKVLLTEKISEAAYRLTIRNYGDKEVTIKIVLPFGQNHGKVIRENIEHKVEGDNVVYWPVQVKPSSEVILRYRVQLMQKG